MPNSSRDAIGAIFSAPRGRLLLLPLRTALSEKLSLCPLLRRVRRERNRCARSVFLVAAAAAAFDEVSPLTDAVASLVAAHR